MEKEQIPTSEILRNESEKTKIWIAGGCLSDCDTGFMITQRGGVWGPLDGEMVTSDGG